MLETALTETPSEKVACAAQQRRALWKESSRVGKEAFTEAEESQSATAPVPTKSKCC